MVRPEQENLKGEVAVKLTREQRDRIDALADRLYDDANPQPHVRIKVSKQQCIDEARKRLFPTPTPARK